MELALSWVPDNKAFIYALKLQLQQNSKFPRLSAEHQICVSAGWTSSRNRPWLELLQGDWEIFLALKTPSGLQQYRAWITRGSSYFSKFHYSMLMLTSPLQSTQSSGLWGVCRRNESTMEKKEYSHCPPLLLSILFITSPDPHFS